MVTLNTTANLTQITAPRVPLIDERTGLVSREWYRFFLSLYNLTGGGQNNTTLTDLQLGPPPAQQEDLTGLVVNIESLKTQPNQESALEQISELEKQIQGLATAIGCACNEVAAELQKQIDALNILPLPNISASLTSGTSILYGNGSGGFSNVAIGSGISFSGGTLSATSTGGTVTNVAALTLGTTGTDLSSTVATSTTTPVITLNVPTASASNRGALNAADWATFNAKQAAGTYVNSVGGTAPVVSSGGTAPVISLAANYGDTQNPYASKTANFVLAAPNGGAGNPTFRAIVAADIPTLNQNTTGNAATVTTNANLTGAVTSTGNATSLGSFTSAQLATALTDETGTGANVFATSPILVTPALGTPSALVGTNITGTAAGLSIGGNAATATNVPYTGLTGTIPTWNQNTTGNAATATNVPYSGLTGTIPTWNQNTTGNAATVTTNANLTGAVTSVGNAASLGSFTSAQLAAALTDETGTGANVFATSPTLVTPALGTPTSLIGTNITGTAAGLSIGGNAATATNASNVTTNANLTGAITSVGNATSLGSFTSAQLATALTDETGTGGNVFATSPILVAPALGTPASGVMTNITGTATGFTSGASNALKSATTDVNTSVGAAPTIGQVLTATSGTTATWQSLAAGVTSVSGTAPIVTTGTTTPVISISAATTGAAGSLSAADKTKLDTYSEANQTSNNAKISFDNTSSTRLANTSGTNTGDNATNSQYSGLVSNATHTGDATGSTVLTIAAGVVTLAKQADIATARFIGRVTAATGVPEALTGTQATTLIDTFTTSLKGLAPSSGGGTSNFLRADGTWSAPSGGGDMVLASAQTVSGAKTFNATTLLMRNVANTFNGSFTNTNTADRIYTLKDAAGTVAFTSDITGTNSGTNTGDNATNTQYSGLVSNATHTGDATGATALTLATVNSNVGTFGSATQASQLTVNAKGLATAAANVTITPAIGSITGLGASVATSLAIAVGSAGGPVTNGGALGTPSSGVATNLTGTAAGLSIGGNAATATNASTVTTNANLTGAVTSVGNAASLGSFTSAQLATALTDETGTGANVFATSPTLVTPALGTPSSGVMTNVTGTASGLTAGNVSGIVAVANGGTGGTSSVYLATPFTSQTSILVTHNFGKYPVVNVIDNTGAVVVPLTITHSSLNAFTVTFSAATTGSIIAIIGY